MKILRAADYKTMPWKNGMGSTTEIAIHPADAKLDDFDWRVSMAQVSSDGAFSSFAAIDRTLLVLEGDGIDLSVAGQADVRIDRETIHSFPGDQTTSARLVAGPIVDLNVMSRRGTTAHSVRRVKVAQSQDFIVSTQTIFVVEQGEIEIASASPVTLMAHDAIIVDAHMPMLTLSANQSTRVVIIEFR